MAIPKLLLNVAGVSAFPFLICLAAARTHAQPCQIEWVPYFTQSIDGPVNCSVVWDPDGAGALPQLLVIGGNFDSIEGTPVGHVAAWDGTSWQSFDTGVSDEVLALAVYGGDLIAAGKFNLAGNVAVNYVARWDGAAWHALGGSVNSHTTAAYAHADSLYVGGYFSEAGGNLAQRVARWDGSVWHAVGDGFSDAVFSFTEYAGDLVAGGLFTHSGPTLVNHIARFDGDTWQPLGSGVTHSNETPIVRALAVQQGQLVAAGNLSPSDVMTWNGSAWIEMNAGLHCDDISCSFNFNCLTIHNGELIAVGSVDYGGSNPPGLAAFRWTGETWHWYLTPSEGVLNTVASYNGLLIVGGDFFSINQLPSAHLAKIAPGVTASLFTPNTTFNEEVRALLVYEGNVIAGGWFSNAPGMPAFRVARWDGTDWHPVGTNISQGVYALTAYKGDLVAGSSFSLAVRRWNKVTEQWDAIGLLGGQVHALAEYNGELYAGGLFNFGGAINIARWNGTAWLPVAGGLNGFVRAFAIYNNELIVGGDFNYSGSRLVRWNGSGFSLPSGVVTGPVYALTVHNGDLIAGGAFGWAGNGFASRVARWNGNAWFAFGAGMPNNVYSLASYNGQLYAGARYITFKQFPAITRWDGTSWIELDGLVNGDVNALTTYGGELMVGGQFTAIGTTASPFWARWANTDLPTIIVQPEPMMVRCANTASFTVAAAGVDLSFQWRLEGQVLTDGATAHGSIISGSTASNLMISNTSDEDSGAYEVTVTNMCGEISSEPAALSWQVCGDANGDGLVNVIDLLEVIGDWGPCPLPPMPCSSDMNDNGTVNVVDLLLVINNWG